MSNQEDKDEVTIELKSPNDKQNDDSYNNEDASRIPLTSNNVKNMELYDVIFSFFTNK